MKTYVKPVLRYENFQLNQSVAGSCGKQTGTAKLADATACAYDDGITGSTIFTTTDICDEVPQSSESYCYQTGSSNPLFNS